MSCAARSVSKGFLLTFSGFLIILIFRLCNLKSLNKSRRGSSEYDSKTKYKVKNLLKKKDKELGLGDISSDSHSSDQDQEQEKSSDDDKFQGFKV